MPKGWANPQHTAWQSSTEYYTICCALSFYHGVDAKMRSLIMRHSLLTSFWLGDGFIWGIWWWCTRSHVARARLAYSPMVTSLHEYSRIPAWLEQRDILWGPQHLWYVWWSVHREGEIWEGLKWFLGKKSRESTSIGPRIGTGTSWSWGWGRDSRNGGWSRPLEWLSAERAQTWLSSTPVRGCLGRGYLLLADFYNGSIYSTIIH